MSFSTEMRGEGERIQLEDGWHTFRVTNMELTISKAGNEMFKVSLEEPDSGAMEDVYCITQKGKRWLLKQLLCSAGIEEDKDGIYHWDIPDIVGKSVEGKNVPEPNEFTRRDGTVVKELRNKINGFRKAQKKATV